MALKTISDSQSSASSMNTDTNNYYYVNSVGSGGSSDEEFVDILPNIRKVLNNEEYNMFSTDTKTSLLS